MKHGQCWLIFSIFDGFRGGNWSGFTLKEPGLQGQFKKVAVKALDPSWEYQS